MQVGVPLIAEESKFIGHVRKTDFYHDFLLKGDLGSAVGIPLWNTPERVCFLAIDYSVRQSAKLSKPAAQMASIIAPHLARSFEVSHRLASVHHGPAQLASLVNRIDAPAMIVDRKRRLRLANSLAEALLRSGRGPKVNREGGVALTDTTADAGLAEAVRACFNPSLAATPCAISFRTVAGGRPSWLNVVPLVADNSVADGPPGRTAKASWSPPSSASCGTRHVSDAPYRAQQSCRPA